MDKFLSCDWGPSAFRLRLIDADTLTVLAEGTSEHGIAAIYAQWNEARKTNQEERLFFYLDFIQQHIEEMEVRLKYPLHKVLLFCPEWPPPQ